MQNYTGYQFGQYELRGILGEGGMGTVYLAYQSNLRREVAIKLLPDRLASESQYMQRFSREAQMAASMEHPYIIPVYDYGNQDDTSYIVMRYLKGGTLDDRLSAAQKQGKLPSLGEIGDLLEKIGGALDYAHQRGLIHRDIKASNIMFDDTGTPYITDFGIARALEGSSSLTATGMTVGTPAYMSPELWQGGDVTPASDQYALAVLAYYLLSGKYPYEAPTPFALMNKHLTEPPPTLEREGMPPALAAVFERAMAKQANERFPSTAEFASAFQAAIAGQAGNNTGFTSRRITGTRPRRITGGVKAGGSSIAAPPMTQTADNRLGWIVWGSIAAILMVGLGLIVFALLSGDDVNQDAVRTQIAIEALQTEFANTQQAIAAAPTATDEPPTATDEPPTVTDEPPTVTDEPPTATDEPLTATDEPPTVTDEPPTATDEPPTVTDEPPTVTDEPPTATDEPPTAQALAVQPTDAPNTETDVPPTNTPTHTSTPSPTPTHTSTPSPTPTHTSTPSPTPTHTSTPSPTPTHTSTPSPTPTHTSTPSPTPTHTSTPSPTPTHTHTPAPTQTPTPRVVGMTPGELIIDDLTAGLPDIREIPAESGDVIVFQLTGLTPGSRASAQLVGLPDTNVETRSDGVLTLRYPVESGGIYQVRLESTNSGPYELLAEAYPSIQPFTQARVLSSLQEGGYLPADLDAQPEDITPLLLTSGPASGEPLLNGIDVTDFVAVTTLQTQQNTVDACGFAVAAGSPQAVQVVVLPDGTVRASQGDTTLLLADHLPPLTDDSTLALVRQDGALTVFVNELFAGRTPSLSLPAGTLQLLAEGEACNFQGPWALALDRTERLAVQAADVPLAFSSQPVNVRTGDGTDFPVVGSLQPDEPAEIIGVSSTGSGWYRIQLQNGRVGWVAPNVVTIEGDATNLLAYDPPAPPNQGNTVTEADPTAAPGDDTVEAEATAVTGPTATPAGETTVEEGPPTGEGEDTETVEGGPTEVPLPYDCTNFAALEPSTGLIQGSNMFYWSPAEGVDSYWVSVFNERGEQIGIRNVPAPATSASITLNFGDGDGFTMRWQVTAQYGQDIVCGTNFISLPRGF